jgi:hypothetical protein
MLYSLLLWMGAISMAIFNAIWMSCLLYFLVGLLSDILWIRRSS